MSYLYLTRHGKTDGNEDENGNELVRAQLEFPLNEQGIKQAEDAGETLKNKPIAYIYHDGMQRTSHTARIIQRQTGGQLVQDAGFKDWNVGKFAGKPLEDVLPELKYYQKHPDSTPPGGESYNTYYDRYQEALLRVARHVNDSVHDSIAINHGRNFSITPHVLSNGDAAINYDHVPEPGTIIPIRFAKGKYSIEDPGSIHPDQG